MKNKMKKNLRFFGGAIFFALCVGVTGFGVETASLGSAFIFSNGFGGV